MWNYEKIIKGSDYLAVDNRAGRCIFELSFAVLHDESGVYPFIDHQPYKDRVIIWMDRLYDIVLKGFFHQRDFMIHDYLSLLIRNSVSIQNYHLGQLILIFWIRLEIF